MNIDKCKRRYYYSLNMNEWSCISRLLVVNGKQTLQQTIRFKKGFDKGVTCNE